MRQTSKQQPVRSLKANSDFPSELLLSVLKADAPITIGTPDNEGNIRLSVPMRRAGLSRAAMGRNRMSRSGFFVDFLGEVLVRKNISKLSAILDSMPPTTYGRLVSSFQHRQFGLIIDKHGVLHFEFHLSLVQRILTEGLAQVLGYENCRP